MGTLHRNPHPKGRLHDRNSPHRHHSRHRRTRGVPVRESSRRHPGAGEIRIRHKACGLNYIDVYHRNGTYPLNLPHGIGMEGSGVIEAVGSGVTHLKVGDRVAYAAQPPGHIPPPA